MQTAVDASMEFAKRMFRSAPLVTAPVPPYVASYTQCQCYDMTPPPALPFQAMPPQSAAPPPPPPPPPQIAPMPAAAAQEYQPPPVYHCGIPVPGRSAQGLCCMHFRKINKHSGIVQMSHSLYQYFHARY